MLCQPVLEELEPLPLSFSLESTPIFGAMKPAQLDVLRPLLKTQFFEPGHVIFCQGELPKTIFVVVTGEVTFSVEGEVSGERRVKDVFREGDALGVASLIGIQAQGGSAQVTSADGATVLTLDCDALIYLEKEHLDIFSLLVLNIARHVSRRLYKEFAAD